MTGQSSGGAIPERLMAGAGILHAGSVARAEAADAVGATVLQWGADLYVVEATLKVRTSPGAASDRAFLRAADSMIQRLSWVTAPATTAEDLILESRLALRGGADPGTQREISRAWSDVGHMAGLAAPRSADLEAAAHRRLGGNSPAAFAALRRAEARAAMDTARHHRIAGRTAEAIQSVYESDLAVLDAALVESAVAVDDPRMLTVTIRWELVSFAIRSIRALPDSVTGAAHAIRRAIGEALGPADGVRVVREFLPVG